MALLVSVLSPRYVNSDWCIKELKEFCTAAKQTGGIRILNKSRLFKVIKTPVSIEQQPQALQPLLGYQFYQYDNGEHFREFCKVYGSDLEKKFWAKLDDLAQDIYRFLKSLRQTSGKSTQAERKAIYLAETTYELTEIRDKFRRELQQHGYIIFPDKQLPYSPQFEEKIREYLERSTLSIHLIG